MALQSLHLRDQFWILVAVAVLIPVLFAAVSIFATSAAKNGDKLVDATPTDQASTVAFVDIDSSPFVNEIISMRISGIVASCNPPVDNRFCPREPITRAELAGVLAISLSLSGIDVDAFSDDAGSPYEQSINAITAAGIAEGCDVNRRLFCPEDFVTRGELAAFLTRSFSLESDGVDRFVDDDVTIFEDDIEAIASAGIVVGCNPPTNTRFCPQRLATREEVAVMMFRALRTS